MFYFKVNTIFWGFLVERLFKYHKYLLKKLYPRGSIAVEVSSTFSGVNFFFKYSLMFFTLETVIFGVRYLSSADIIGDLHSFSLLHIMTSLYAEMKFIHAICRNVRFYKVTLTIHNITIE